MDRSEIQVLKRRIAARLLPELMSEEPRKWYYLSMANDTTFFCGVYVKAHGMTDAWCMMQGLNMTPHPDEFETLCYECDEHAMEKVPLSMRWRKLSCEEVESIK